MATHFVVTNLINLRVTLSFFVVSFMTDAKFLSRLFIFFNQQTAYRLQMHRKIFITQFSKNCCISLKNTLYFKGIFGVFSLFSKAAIGIPAVISKIQYFV